MDGVAGLIALTVALTAGERANGRPYSDRARRADLAPGERSIDILVIDDQPDHEAGWFARHLPSHRRLSLESVSEMLPSLARLTTSVHMPAVKVVRLAG